MANKSSFKTVEEWRTYQREYQKRPSQTLYKREYMRKRRKKLGTHKDKVRLKVWYAVKKGILTPEKCKCGESKVEAHHPDYRKHLSVVWLCRLCHIAEHRK